MSRIEQRLTALGEQRRKGLIPYITAGDPNTGETLRIMHSLVASGADLIELGVPFSDPMADGPVIQRACERALANGCTSRDVLEVVRRFRETDTETPVVLMGYLNPVEAMGYEAFAENAAQAGVDGVLMVDLPPEEAGEVVPWFRAQGLDLIFLISPTTSDERIRRMGEHSSGYVYYVSLKGVTGSASIDAGAVEERVAHIRELTELPVGVGFGIRDAETAGAIGRVSDAIIVGSVIVDCIGRHPEGGDSLHQALKSLVKPLRDSLDTP
ncbi:MULTISPECIES: tryptophan synthase subunit alpha [Halomonadaceae]|uniref:Tryptophan synthase alpha chain n=1 Tax=Vreelandella halophila TaxID=86177 RepID=A0A9X5B5N3_9GAMM|nr:MULTISPECIES: tryptophan synthase subunit alpha [Halomonas]MYL27520.1 tryptophan synthase subunit alpha [Halomonas utahensis]MYL74646.1 tryptophan synthase subunit alpha [Halomonas sp. 22501_18_FS]